MTQSSQIIEFKEKRQVGKCKHCGTAIYLTEKGNLLIRGSWDCIHELEIEDGDK